MVKLEDLTFRLVESEFGISKADVLSKKRISALIPARHCCYWIISKMSKRIDEKIATIFDRDRATIYHGRDKVEDLVDDYIRGNSRFMSRIDQRFAEKCWNIYMEIKTTEGVVFK